MAQLLFLEEFEPTTPASHGGLGLQLQGANSKSAAVEAARVAAYEQGYSAGWDDAVNAAGKEQDKISTDFSHKLQDLSFTFYEAKSHVIHSLSPLLMAMVNKLLPELVAQAIGQKILEEILPLAELAAETPIQVVVAPCNRAALEPLLANATTAPLELVEETTLGPGQVFLRSGKFEKHIDLESAIQRISEAITSVETGNQEAFAHG